MDFKNKKNQLIVGVVILALLIAGWFMLRGGDSSETILIETASDPVEAILGAQLLASMEKMKNVKLDTSFFNSAIYKSLQDFYIEIPKQPIGRRNPFAPLTSR